MARKWRFLSHRLPWWLAAFLPASALVVSGIAFIFPHRLLTIESGDVKADVIIVLGGGTDERPTRAAELFKAGAAPRILGSGFGDDDVNVQILKHDGVPEAVIFREPRSISTLENANFSIPLLRQKGARRVIIVTSWYHSRRALACFRQAAPDIEFYSRPAYRTYPRTEWSRQGTSGYIRAEYMKLLGYWICYGVSPFLRVSSK
jgi:uncharacterized SAM-binding protein YcdF (DUF218 family)